MSLLSDLRGDTPLPVRKRRFVRMATYVLWLFTFGCAFAVLRIYFAIRSSEVWLDYRGIAVSESALRTDLLFFLMLGVLTGISATLWMRFWRSRI